MGYIYDICPLATQYCHACVDDTLGRVTAVGIYRREYRWNNISDIAEWLDLYAAGYALIIPEVRGTYDGSSPIENAGYGMQNSRLISRNHTATWMSPWTCDNQNFYNSLSQSDDYNFVFILNDLYLLDTGTPTNFVATMPITENLTDVVEFNVTAKWASKDLPACYDVPLYIFDSCQSLARQIACYTPREVPLIPCAA